MSECPKCGGTGNARHIATMHLPVMEYAPCPCGRSKSDSPRCDAVGCQAGASVAYVDKTGAVYLCEFHGGGDVVDGWHRLADDLPGMWERADLAGGRDHHIDP